MLGLMPCWHWSECAVCMSSLEECTFGTANRMKLYLYWSYLVRPGQTWSAIQSRVVLGAPGADMPRAPPAGV